MLNKGEKLFFIQYFENRRMELYSAATNQYTDEVFFSQELVPHINYAFTLKTNEMLACSHDHIFHLQLVQGKLQISKLIKHENIDIMLRLNQDHFITINKLEYVTHLWRIPNMKPLRTL